MQKEGSGKLPLIDSHAHLKEVARLKGLDPSVVAEQTTENASRFFKIPF